MRMQILLCASLLVAGGMETEAQEVPIPQLSPGSTRRPTSGGTEKDKPAPLQSIALNIPKGTPLQVALDKEVRVKKVGQSIHARVVEPVYAFDRIVIPMGAEVTGQVRKIGAISGGKRTLAALDSDFTPSRSVEVGFDHLRLPDGRDFPFQTTVTAGSGQVIRFVAAAGEGKNEKKGVKDAAGDKTREAKARARQEWDNAMSQLKTPGRVHRLERYVEAQLPVHAQYIPAGTVYFAELEQALDFGTVVMTTEMASSMGVGIPPGSVVRARLITPLSSATAQKGEDVEAVLSRPLLDVNRHVILPQGSRLQGTVRQAEPAHRMKKNGQLRITFQQLVPPEGMQQKVEATLEGVQSGKDAHVKLDSEGGAEATTPKTRYLTTALSLSLAAASMRTDEDAGRASQAGGDTGSRVAGGANGFKLVGMTLGLLVHSRALGYTMGAYGAGMSVYSNFIARGREVVFPKNTAMEIGIGNRQEGQANSSPPTQGSTKKSIESSR
jgi:hypothetical protein